MLNDYRNTEYCPTLDNIADKKQAIVDEIKKDHKRAKNMYTYISASKLPYKIKFIRAYNEKCSYCGVSLDIIECSSFEIDHFIPKKAKKFKGNTSEAGAIENIVLACRTCNRKKGNFLISDKDYKYLYPDTKEIQQTFIRDDKYYIRIFKDFMSNKTIQDFYITLNLGSEIHRIDYLLMSMIKLYQKIEKEKPEIAAELIKKIEKLRRKRNVMSI